MTPAQKEWRELQRHIHRLQAASITPDERRQLAQVLTLVETHLYSVELDTISHDTQESLLKDEVIIQHSGTIDFNSGAC